MSRNLSKSISNKHYNKGDLYEVPYLLSTYQVKIQIWFGSQFCTKTRDVSIEFEVSATAFDKYVEQ